MFAKAGGMAFGVLLLTVPEFAVAQTAADFYKGREVHLLVGALLGVKVKVIYGYQGGIRTSNLAMQRGELDGTCGVYIVTIRSQFADQLKSGNLIVWMTFGLKRDPAFPDVPNIYEVLKNDNDRKLAELIFKQDILGRPLAAPPGLPADRTAALRTAFMATMDDKDFLAEANKAKLAIHPMNGEETQKAYAAFFTVSKDTVARAKAITSAK